MTTSYSLPPLGIFISPSSNKFSNILQAVELNVIGYRSYAEVFVTVLPANEFTPQLTSKTGNNIGVISEDADLNTFVRVSGFSNSLLQVVITDADYVSALVYL